ncbi:uncharacterized protein LOC111379009 [Olea europaea var. sylvestris]|uniref:uncharacterized protein LOC111379009 n=1 Tax=Olea europaea var. sylvestris TaxID=158386 RepID=UPI000C1D1718|nr:uncharacterized protein LOC111379009 [Olea europaea var. sylvestris]
MSRTYKAIILLNSMPDTYKEVKNTIKYGRDTLTPEIVIEFLRRRWKLVLKSMIRKMEIGKRKVKERNEVNVLFPTSDVDDSEVYMITSSIAYTSNLNLTANSRMHEWILDSVASFRMTSEKNWFENLHEFNAGHIMPCDNFAYSIAEIVDINIRFDTSFVYTLKDVRYIPELSSNLILVGRLEKNDFTDKIGNGTLKMINGALVSIKGTKKNDI